MDPTVTTYVVYLLIAVPLTIWVATTLARNGRTFLVDVFGGNEALAHAVNRLLVVGFYLLTLGFVALLLRMGDEVATIREGFEVLSVKLGIVMLILGVLHACNVYVFNAIRRRHLLGSRRTPPVPQGPPNPSPYPGPQ